ncbi:hypothetical protein Btru_063371 [Bulinus truncatus]|nr:hypothetical protein Btru_063371 [Bulinus truncatus]
MDKSIGQSISFLHTKTSGSQKVPAALRLKNGCSSTKWIGPNKKFLCNCVNDQCLDDGQCERDVKCRDGYFGYACQYSDASFGLKQEYNELTDNDETTCLNNKDRDTITVQTGSARIYFVKAFFSAQVDMNEINFSFEDSAEKKSCNGFLITGRNSSVEYHCKDVIQVTSVIIGGSAVKTICSVYVSKGRNMALKSSVRIDSGISANQLAELTDGDRDNKDESCTNFSIVVDKASVYLSFYVPVRIDNIALTLGSVTRNNLGESHLTSIDSNGNQIWRQAFDPIPKQTIRYSHNGQSKGVKHLLLSFVSADLKMYMCELEAYGGCSKNCGGDKSCSQNRSCTQGCITGYHGAECLFNCKASCGGNGSCDLKSGYCNECQTQYWGSYCLQNCSANCGGTQNCEIKSGDCNEGCKTGFWGHQCLDNCSSTCGGDGSCYYKSGNCREGCKARYWGSQCLHNCSKTCGGAQNCDAKSGNCTEGCEKGFWGPHCLENCSATCGGSQNCVAKSGHCSEGCKKGFWGSHCLEDCSTNCDGDGSCDSISGNCNSGCKAKYWGSQCMQECSVNCGGNGSCERDGSCQAGCKEGYYGLNCAEKCSVHCGGNGRCDKIFGQCTAGCKVGYHGLTCTEECSVNCGGNGSCEINTGHCTSGCKDIYHGFNCTERGLQGTDGTWTCHCAEGNCSDESNMCPTEQCIKGWFAYSCQYSDAGAFAEMTNPELNDNNDSTCYEYHNNSVTAKWTAAQNVSWVRLIFHPRANVSNFRIQYHHFETVKMCQSPKSLQVPNMHNMFDLDCFVFESATHVTVAWNGEGSLCTFNICNGRNMALISGSYVKKNISRILVPSLIDGDVHVKHCSTFNANESAILNLDLKQPVTINSVIFFTTLSKTMTTLQLIFVKYSIRTGYKMTYTLMGNKTVHQFYIATDIFTMLEIRLLSGQINICEVELYGDCILEKFGQHCEGICRFTCYKNRCTYDGRCFDCVLGRSGPHCETLEPTNFYDNEEAKENNADTDLTDSNTLQTDTVSFGYLWPCALILLLLGYLLHKKNDRNTLVSENRDEN